MAERLNDKKRKQVVAFYIETGNFSATARHFGLSANGVKKIVNSDTESAEKFTLKKEENTASVLAHMDNKKKDVCTLIDILLAAINNPEKIAATPINLIATTMGILIDKYTVNESGKLLSSVSLADSIKQAYEKRVGAEDDENA